MSCIEILISYDRLRKSTSGSLIWLRLRRMLCFTLNNWWILNVVLFLKPNGAVIVSLGLSLRSHKDVWKRRNHIFLVKNCKIITEMRNLTICISKPRCASAWVAVRGLGVYRLLILQSSKVCRFFWTMTSSGGRVETKKNKAEICFNFSDFTVPRHGFWFVRSLRSLVLCLLQHLKFLPTMKYPIVLLPTFYIQASPGNFD